MQIQYVKNPNPGRFEMGNIELANSKGLLETTQGSSSVVGMDQGKDTLKYRIQRVFNSFYQRY